MRCATVYLRNEDLIVHAMSRTTDGVWILTQPCGRLPADVANELLGRASRKALNASQSRVPHPTDFKEVVAPLLQAAAVKSWAAFARSAVCVELEEPEPGAVRLVPTTNLGGSQGFIPKPERRRMVSPADEADLGQAIRAALTEAS